MLSKNQHFRQILEDYRTSKVRSGKNRLGYVKKG